MKLKNAILQELIAGGFGQTGSKLYAIAANHINQAVLGFTQTTSSFKKQQQLPHQHPRHTEHARASGQVLCRNLLSEVCQRQPATPKRTVRGRPGEGVCWAQAELEQTLGLLNCASKTSWTLAAGMTHSDCLCSLQIRLGGTSAVGVSSSSNRRRSHKLNSSCLSWGMFSINSWSSTDLVRTASKSAFPKTSALCQSHEGHAASQQSRSSSASVTDTARE